MTPQQKQYKLINLETKEEFICDKVVIEGMDYYVTASNIQKGEWQYYHYSNSKQTILKAELDLPNDGRRSLVIATKNPSIDVPKVIDSIEDLSEVSSEVQEATYTIQHKITYKHGFKDGYSKAKETYTFTEGDMIEFAGYYLLECRENRYKPIDKMLKDWKEQRIETIYFKS